MAKRRKGRKTSASKASYNKPKADSSKSRGGNQKVGDIVKGKREDGKAFTWDGKKHKRDALTGRWTYNTSSRVKDIGSKFKEGKKATESSKRKKSVKAITSETNLKAKLEAKLREYQSKSTPKPKDEEKGGVKTLDDTKKKLKDLVGKKKESTPPPSKEKEAKPKTEPKKTNTKPKDVKEIDDGYVGKGTKQPKGTPEEAKFNSDSLRDLDNAINGEDLSKVHKNTIKKALEGVEDETEKSVLAQLILRDQPTKTQQKLADKVRLKILKGETTNLLTEKQMISAKAAMVKHHAKGKLETEANMGIQGEAVNKFNAEQDKKRKATKDIKNKKPKTPKEVKKAVEDSGAKRAKDIANEVPKKPKTGTHTKPKKEAPKKTEEAPPEAKPVVKQTEEKPKTSRVLDFDTDEEAKAYIERSLKGVELTEENKKFAEMYDQDPVLIKMAQSMGYTMKFDTGQKPGVGGYHNKATKVLALTPHGLTPGMRRLNVMEHELLHALQNQGGVSKTGYLNTVGIDYTRILTPEQAAKYVLAYENGRSIPIELEAFAASHIGGTRVLATALKRINEGKRDNENQETSLSWWKEMREVMGTVGAKRYREALKEASLHYPELRDYNEEVSPAMTKRVKTKQMKNMSDKEIDIVARNIDIEYPKSTTRWDKLNPKAETWKDAQPANDRVLNDVLRVLDRNSLTRNVQLGIQDLLKGTESGRASLTAFRESADAQVARLKGLSPEELAKESRMSISNLGKIITAGIITQVQRSDTLSPKEYQALNEIQDRAKAMLYAIYTSLDEEQQKAMLKASDYTPENLGIFTSGSIGVDRQAIKSPSNQNNIEADEINQLAKQIAANTPKKPAPKEKKKQPEKKFVSEETVNDALAFKTNEEARKYMEDRMKSVKLTPENQKFVDEYKQDPTIVKLVQKLGYTLEFKEFSEKIPKGVNGYHNKERKAIGITPGVFRPGREDTLEHEVIHALQNLGGKDKYGQINTVGIDYTKIINPRQAARYISGYDSGHKIPMELEAFAANHIGGTRVLATAVKLMQEKKRDNANQETDTKWWVEFKKELGDKNSKKFQQALKSAYEHYPALRKMLDKK